MKNIFLLFVALFIVSSCTNKKNKFDKYNTALKFMEYANNDDITGCYSLLRETGQRDDTEIFSYHIHKLHDFFNRYGIPVRSKWQIKYDTTAPLIKLENIVIPIHDGFDSSNKLEHASLELDFDYTQEHLSNDFIVSYYLDISLRPQKVDTSYVNY